MVLTPPAVGVHDGASRTASAPTAVCQYASLRARGARPAAERRARLAYRWFPRPDVTFLLVVDPEVAYDRIERRGYDHEEMSFLYSAAAAYRSLPEFAEFVVIDANGTPDEVAAAIRAHLPVPAPIAPATRDQYADNHVVFVTAGK